MIYPLPYIVMYTVEQLTSLWNYVVETRDKIKHIEKGLAYMFEEQYPPFVNFFELNKIVNILDPKLGDILDYVFYECVVMKSGGLVTKDGKEHIIPGNLDGFLYYCDIEGLIK